MDSFGFTKRRRMDRDHKVTAGMTIFEIIELILILHISLDDIEAEGRQVKETCN